VNVSASQAAWLQRQLDAAKGGKTGWMSRLMQEVIPFNRPHRLTVESLSNDACEVALPWRRRNLNHVGTMHACALATAAEYASGICVLSAIGVGTVRLVMAELKMQYGRRAETACVARATMSAEVLADVQTKLAQEGRGAFDLYSVVRDARGEVVAEAHITWHVKSLKG
jgi:acyl-coenzyme A thioesterase PaaI-like protein